MKNRNVTYSVTGKVPRFVCKLFFSEFEIRGNVCPNDSVRA